MKRGKSPQKGSVTGRTLWSSVNIICRPLCRGKRAWSLSATDDVAQTDASKSATDDVAPESATEATKLIMGQKRGHLLALVMHQDWRHQHPTRDIDVWMHWCTYIMYVTTASTIVNMGHPVQDLVGPRLSVASKTTASEELRAKVD